VLAAGGAAQGSDLPWLWQQPDGRWPAVAVAFSADASGANRSAVVDRAGRPERDLRATALVVLAVVADGQAQLGRPARHGEALLRQARRWVLASPDRRNPTSPSARAARRLLRALGELAPEAEHADAPSTTPTDPSSPATSLDATEPLVALYDVLSAYRSGAYAWRRISPQVAREIAKAPPQRGPWAGTWEPVGAFGADSGRFALAAVHTITLTVYYRYCRLEVATAPAGRQR
jgi:hypothetical protein